MRTSQSLHLRHLSQFQVVIMMDWLVMEFVMMRLTLQTAVMMVETVVDMMSSMTIAQIAAANLFISIKVAVYPS